jgi:dehydrogenase/reductase SDR family protein 7B
MMAINCSSHIAVVSAVLPGMIERKRGQIVNVLSVSGLIGNPLRTLYCASKFGLSGFGKALRGEVQPHGITVHQIYPAYVRTNISQNAMTGTGETFSKLDGNIAKGIPVDKCTREIMRALHHSQDELIIGSLYYRSLPTILMFIP